MIKITEEKKRRNIFLLNALVFKMMKHAMLRKKSIRFKSPFRRFIYAHPPHFLIEPTASPTTQLSANAPVTNSQDGVIPIASLFSSMDLGQPSSSATTTTKKRPLTAGARMRRAVSFNQTEQDKDQITTYVTKKEFIQLRSSFRP